MPRWQAGSLGIVSTQVAMGGDAADSGWLAGVGLEHNGRRLSAYLQTQFSSRNFSQLGASLFESTPRQRTFAGIGLNFDTHGTLQFAYGLQSFYDADTVATLGLSYSLSLQRFGYLGLFATHADSSAADSSILLTWTMPLGDRRSISSAVQYAPDASGRDDGLQAMTSFRQNLPTGSGIGYSVSLSTDDEADLGVAYQGHAGLRRWTIPAAATRVVCGRVRRAVLPSPLRA